MPYSAGSGKKMNKKLVDALEACLQKMEHGETLDSVLASYPQLAAQLRPLLGTAMRARSANREPIPQTLLARSRSRGVSFAADLREGRIRPPVLGRFWRPVVTIFSVIVILAMSSNGILVASAHSIPGDTLYPLKLSVESTQLNLVSDLAQRQALEQTFRERRVDETKSLISIRRIEEVDFTGVVTSKSGDEWLVSGIPVVITAQVDKDDAIQIGDDIDVNGSTDSAGSVKALRLSLANGPDADEDYPGVSATQTASPTLTPKSDFTATPTESALNPAHSDEFGKQVVNSNDRQSKASGDDQSSGDASSNSRSNSEGGGDD
jgi:hypothetical protein